MKYKFIVPLQDGLVFIGKNFWEEKKPNRTTEYSANNWEKFVPWQKFASSSLSDDVSTRIWWQLREIGVTVEEAVIPRRSYHYSFAVKIVLRPASTPFWLTFAHQRPILYFTSWETEKKRPSPTFLSPTTFRATVPNYSLWQISFITKLPTLWISDFYVPFFGKECLFTF